MVKERMNTEAGWMSGGGQGARLKLNQEQQRLRRSRKFGSGQDPAEAQTPAENPAVWAAASLRPLMKPLVEEAPPSLHPEVGHSGFCSQDNT